MNSHRQRRSEQRRVFQHCLFLDMKGFVMFVLNYSLLSIDMDPEHEMVVVETSLPNTIWQGLCLCEFTGA